jgi:NitT/TauT family transport system ATP-binding protein
MTEISVRHLTKRYGDALILENVSVDLPDHEFCVILGPSGAGKTTLLRILLSQETPSGGAVLIDGEPLDPEPQPDRGVVFQRYSVFPHMTALKNVMLGPQLRAAPVTGRLWGAKRRALREKAAALLEEVGLGHALEKVPVAVVGRHAAAARHRAGADHGAQGAAARRALRRARSGDAQIHAPADPRPVGAQPHDRGDGDA